MRLSIRQSPPRTGVPTPGACSGSKNVHVEAYVQEPRATPRANAWRMQGSIPTRSTSLIVNTFASSFSQQLALAPVERAHAHECELPQL